PPAAAGTAVSSQTAGDCQRNQCDGSGSVASVPDDSDVPVDGNQCTNDVCTNCVPSNPPSAPHSACSQSGGSLCDGAGNCVSCLAASDCPGVDTECSVRTCTAGACGVAYTAAGTPVSGQSPGDCHVNVCDGAGNTVSAIDNSDAPADDGNVCTSEACIG